MKREILERKGIRAIKKTFIAMAGFIVLIAGVAMIALPGPAVLVIPLGLAILATQFAWAKKLMDKAKELLKKAHPPNRSPNEPNRRG